MLRVLIKVSSLPAVYVASTAYWFVFSRLVERRLQIWQRHDTGVQRAA